MTPGGNGRDKNFVVFDVRGGIENVLDEKLIWRRLFVLFGSNVALPPPPSAL
jgi:hypothetical protein